MKFLSNYPRTIAAKTTRGWLYKTAWVKVLSQCFSQILRTISKFITSFYKVSLNLKLIQDVNPGVGLRTGDRRRAGAPAVFFLAETGAGAKLLS